MVFKSLDDFAGVHPDGWFPYISSGAWSHHQLIEKIISIIGSCHATILTYTISEESLRSLWSMVHKDDLFSFTLIADHSCFRNKKSLMHFACNIKSGDIYTASLHSKLVILQNERWKISIFTSANMTPNPRIESGVLCSVPRVGIECLHEISSIIDKSVKVKFNE